MSNSTLLAQPETYMAIYHELSHYNVHLNVFERLWAVGPLPANPAPPY
jgi:methylsterol monooxygenase